MEEAPELMTQAAFARHMNVSRAAVSQWKKKKVLRADAFNEKGLIKVDIAANQVRTNRDIGQSLGNGIATRTDVRTESLPKADPPQKPLNEADVDGSDFQEQQGEKGDGRPRIVTIEDQLRQAKLEEQLRRNRLQAADEALRQGVLMSADDAREQMSRIAGMMLQIFEGALPDIATAVAEQFSLQQRDVLHMLRSEFKNVRKTAARKERASRDATQANLKVAIDQDG